MVLALVLEGGACTHVNRVTLIASTAALVCDWGETHRAASRGWRTSAGVQYESNPILGPHPSTDDVAMYFATAAAINAAIWVAMPRKLKSLVPLAVIGAQVAPLMNNARTSPNCGL